MAEIAVYHNHEMQALLGPSYVVDPASMTRLPFVQGNKIVFGEENDAQMDESYANMTQAYVNDAALENAESNVTTESDFA